MADVVLKNVTKVYPLSDKKKKEGKFEIDSEGIRKHSDGVVAVESFNLDVQDGEFIVFVGPSGCGKTTTLRMIAGLEEITDGELYIDNILVNEVPPKERDIAMVFQSYALYPHMTVYDNIAFSLKMHKVDKSEITKKVCEIAQILDIEDLLSRKPKELSGGQRQRVAIGRALVRNPKVLLMDEPLSNLDAKLRSQTRAELINLHNKLRTTIIYVTHDQVEAMTLADRIVVMKDGIVQQIGTPHEIYTNPKNRFVAGFIGSPQMNFIEGCELIKQEQGYVIRLFGETLILSNQQCHHLQQQNIEEGFYTVGIRPSDLDTRKKLFSAEVDFVEMLGSEELIHFEINGKKLICSMRINSYESNHLKQHNFISFGFNIDTIKLFNDRGIAVLASDY